MAAASDQVGAQSECAASGSSGIGDYLGPVLRSELHSFAEGTALRELPALSALFQPAASSAAELTGQFVAAIAGHLRCQPRAQVPLRQFSNDHSATLILHNAGSATLALQALCRSASGLPTAALFSPVESHAHVVAGNGQAILLERPGSEANRSIRQHPSALKPGKILTCIGQRQGLVITRVNQPLVMLKLQRTQPGCEAARMIDLQTGHMLRQAAGNLADTRLDLAAAVLGAMARRDAAPVLASAARTRRGAAARWQALRAALALDSVAGFSALSAIARCGDDPLAMPAQALQAQLLSAWPQLREHIACR